MFKTIDLYLGIFLVLCGFGISLLNLRSIVFRKNRFSSILLSENILLSCIGIAFLCRAIYSLNPTNVDAVNIELRFAGIHFGLNKETTNCGFSSLLLSYGPLVVSLVNSFISLIVDNYMHYKMLKDIKTADDQNIVQRIGEGSRSIRQEKINKTCKFFKKYFSYFTIAFQWIVPVLMVLLMYPMNVKEMSTNEVRSSENTCMAMLDLSKSNCSYSYMTWETFPNITELRTYVPTANYMETMETGEPNRNVSNNIATILSNVINIVRNYNNQTDFAYTNITKSLRRPKLDDLCMRICFTDNQNMLIYMLILAFISYFVPITISAIILTKIHIMQVNRPSAKTYVTRELLYNILFWTPVMFDTFLSLIMCSFSMQSMRTSLFNVIANVYQVIKNFMNTRYFKENEIMPV